MRNYRFTPFKWHKRILVPCWILQLSFILFLFIIAMWDYVNGYLVATRAVLVLLELLTLVLILHENILFIRLSALGGPSSSNIASIIRAPLFILTPTNYLVFQVLKTLIWSLLFSAGAWLTLADNVNSSAKRGLLTMLPNSGKEEIIANFPDSYLGLALHGIALALFFPSLIYGSVMLHIFRRNRRRDNATVTARPMKTISFNPIEIPQISPIHITHELPDTPTYPPSTLQQPPNSPRHRHQPSPWKIQLPESLNPRANARNRHHSLPEIHELSAVKSVPNSKPNSKSSSKPSSRRVTRTLAQLASLVANRSPWPSTRTSRHVEEGLWEDRREDYPEKVIDDYVDDTDDEADDGNGNDEEQANGGMAWPLSDDSASSVDHTNTVSPVSEATWQRGGTLRTIVSPLTDKAPGGMF